VFRSIKLVLPRHFFKGLYQFRECAVVYLFVLGVSILPVSTISQLGFGTVLNVWYLLSFILLLNEYPSKTRNVPVYDPVIKYNNNNVYR